jgi:hypothetical protein
MRWCCRGEYLSAFAIYGGLQQRYFRRWAMRFGVLSMALPWSAREASSRLARWWGFNHRCEPLGLTTPLDSLRGALLIIGFYLATGLVHHLLDRDLEWATTAEYLIVAAVGTAAVVVTRVFV